MSSKIRGLNMPDEARAIKNRGGIYVISRRLKDNPAWGLDNFCILLKKTGHQPGFFHSYRYASISSLETFIYSQYSATVTP